MNQQYCQMMWAGDQNVDWSKDDGLPSVITAALSLAMCGSGLHHSDIGGYTTLYGLHRSKELLLRWAAFCTFTPVMRSHAHPFVEQAPKVCEAILGGKAEKGILICGTGQGMAIVANKYKGIYACVVDDIFSAERAKIINNANVITMGGWITAPFLGTQIVDACCCPNWCFFPSTSIWQTRKGKVFHTSSALESSP